MSIITHNLLAMNADRMLGITDKRRSKSTEKLSSGYKINRSADDAAGLAISEKMRKQIRGLNRAVMNAQDGISLVQIADGAMEEVQDMIHRSVELSMQAANGTLSDSDRSALQAEIDQIKKEIDRISDTTKFNDIPVLKGSETEPIINHEAAKVIGGLPDWVGIDSSSTSSGQLSNTFITTHSFDYSYTDESGVTQTGSESVSVEHAASILDFSALNNLDATALQAKIDELTQKDTGFYTTCCTCDAHYSIQFKNGGGNSKETSGYHHIYNIDISDAQNGSDVVNKILAFAGSNPNNHFTNLAVDPTDSSKLVVYDNRGKSLSALNEAKNLLSSKFGSSYIYTINSWSPAPKYPSSAASPSPDRGLFGPGVAHAAGDVPEELPPDIFLQVGFNDLDRISIKLPSISTGALKIAGVNVSTETDAQNALNSFDYALHFVSTERSRMGAYQNRLEHTVNNLNNIVENTTSAESQIRDTDMATEMVKYANDNILAQAGNSMLTQANQNQQNILRLLQ